MPISVDFAAWTVIPILQENTWKKLSGIIKEYHSDDCFDYAKVQETLGTIYLMTVKLSQAKTHFKKAFKIYEKIWADEPEMIEAKYQEIQNMVDEKMKSITLQDIIDWYYFKIRKVKNL